MLKIAVMNLPTKLEMMFVLVLFTCFLTERHLMEILS